MGSKPGPSAFAQILRRSKFASFDPNIGQVYTTYGGFAHRGDWGLKRSLPLRKRHPYAIIQAIDTAEYQTEWRNGESEGRWIKRWEETGRRADVDQESGWLERQNNTHSSNFDSEFTHGSYCSWSEKESDEQFPIPNLASMSPKQFESYLRRSRDLHSEFKKFIEEYRIAEHEKLWYRQFKDMEPAERPPPPPLPPLNLYGIAQRSLTIQYLILFLTRGAKDALRVPTSTVIISNPHPNGALHYTQPGLLQTHLTSQAIPGRVLAAADLRTGTDMTTRKIQIAGLAGMTAELPKAHSDGLTELDWGRSDPSIGRTNPEAGKTVFRIAKADIKSIPRTVGRQPEGLDGTRIALEVRSFKGIDKIPENPHRPGSVEYVGCRSDVSGDRTKSEPQDLVKSIDRQISKRPVEETATLLNTIENIMSSTGNR